MPKTSLTINDFSGGLSTDKSSRDLDPNELSTCENVDPSSRGKIISSHVFSDDDDNFTDFANSAPVNGTGLFVFSNEVVLVNIHFYFALLALSLGPVSLVTAILSVRSLFLLFFTLLVSILFNWSIGESVSPKIILIKALSTTVIVVGLVLLVI